MAEGTHLYGDRAPHNEEFVVLAASIYLTEERVLTGTANQITITDSGAGLAVTLSLPQDFDTGADVQLGSLGVGVSPDVDIGIYIEKTLTDTDNSGKAALRAVAQVAKTSAAMTSAGWGVYGQVYLDSTNTQNWTHAESGLRGVCGFVGTEVGSTGTVTHAANFFAKTVIEDAATITNLYGVRVCTPTVAGAKVTNEYGLYVCDQNTGATLNYAIYTNAGLVHIGDVADFAADVTATDFFVPDGGTFGITGNELLTFNAAGTAVFSGCNVTVNGDVEINGILDVDNLTVNTTADFVGADLRWTKTAGATDTSDNFYGTAVYAGMDQSGGTIGYLYGQLLYAIVTDGNVGDTDTARGAVGLFCSASLDGGKVWGDAYGLEARVDQAGGAEVTNDIAGLHVWVDADGTTGGDVHMIYLTERSNVDFGIYQNGTAVNYFGGNVGILVADPHSALEVAGAISSATLDLSAAGPTDNLNVAGVNTVFVNTSGNNVTLGGTVGGVDGQILNIVVHDATNNFTIEHNEGTGNQDFILHAGADETMTGEYGGWVFVNDGGDHWHDASHAKHV